APRFLAHVWHRLEVGSLRGRRGCRVGGYPGDRTRSEDHAQGVPLVPVPDRLSRAALAGHDRWDGGGRVSHERRAGRMVCPGGLEGPEGGRSAASTSGADWLTWADASSPAEAAARTGHWAGPVNPATGRAGRPPRADRHHHGGR